MAAQVRYWFEGRLGVFERGPFVGDPWSAASPSYLTFFADLVGVGSCSVEPRPTNPFFAGSLAFDLDPLDEALGLQTGVRGAAFACDLGLVGVCCDCLSTLLFLVLLGVFVGVLVWIGCVLRIGEVLRRLPLAVSTISSSESSSTVSAPAKSSVESEASASSAGRTFSRAFVL